MNVYRLIDLLNLGGKVKFTRKDGMETATTYNLVMIDTCVKMQVQDGDNSEHVLLVDYSLENLLSVTKKHPAETYKAVIKKA